MSRRYLALALIIVALGGALRTLWLRADPPTTSVGIIFHDEGAWVHNARNRALWGGWITDQWNPVYIAPVFTGLEYAAFSAFGVGTWQARTVPAASGLLALVALMAGLSVVAGHRVALVGGLLLATEYTWVMWNRAALMESTMTMFMVVAWAAYALASRRPIWGLVAGASAALAWFTKASAAFFVAAIVLDAAMTWLAPKYPGFTARFSSEQKRAALWTIIGGAVTGGAIALAFVWPHWTEYWFYNVQMSVERKPSYDLTSVLNRATWLPLTHDIFAKLWPLLAAAALAIGGVFARWRTARPAERLLVWWVLLGLLELTAHDSSNERRFIMFIPAIIALASLAIASGTSWIPSPQAAAATIRSRFLFLPVALALGYVVIGSALQPLLVVDKAADHPYQLAVRVSAALTLVGGACLFIWWQRIVGWLSAHGLRTGATSLLVAVMVVWNLGQFGQWAARRTYLNYDASVALGRLLPPGTAVQGKLANGMDLENQIKPIFIGLGFGNYSDRFDRNDVRYILTYDLPEIGFESQRHSGLIQEILDRYPNRQTVATFDVDETPGPDRAVLIDKRIPRARD